MNRVAAMARVAALSGAAVALALPAAAQERVRWQVPMSFASTLTALGDTMPWVADQLRTALGLKSDTLLTEDELADDDSGGEQVSEGSAA